jgi:hypothetical protein
MKTLDHATFLLLIKVLFRRDKKGHGLFFFLRTCSHVGGSRSHHGHSRRDHGQALPVRLRPGATKHGAADPAVWEQPSVARRILRGGSSYAV